MNIKKIQDATEEELLEFAERYYKIAPLPHHYPTIFQHYWRLFQYEKFKQTIKEN